jgi:hypothetical protein
LDACFEVQFVTLKNSRNTHKNWTVGVIADVLNAQFENKTFIHQKQ